MKEFNEMRNQSLVHFQANEI